MFPLGVLTSSDMGAAGQREDTSGQAIKEIFLAMDFSLARYEIVPEFAPYIGLEYEAKTGETADIARLAGEDPDGLKIAVGLRAWF